MNPLHYDLRTWLRINRGRFRSWQRREREIRLWAEAHFNRFFSAAHQSYVEAGQDDPMFGGVAQ